MPGGTGLAKHSPFVIGLTGYTCSGKSWLARLLGSRGFSVINLGDFTREVARERNIPVRRHESWDLFASLIKENPSWRVPRILEAMRKLDSDHVVIDGIRTPEEAEALKKQIGLRFLLVEVRLKDSLRLARAGSRRREVDHEDWNEQAQERWLKMDKEEVAMIDRIRPLVDVVVDGGETNES